MFESVRYPVYVSHRCERKFLTQKATNHPNGPVTAEHGGLAPAPAPISVALGITLIAGGLVVLMDIPPTTISTRSVVRRRAPMGLFWAKI